MLSPNALPNAPAAADAAVMRPRIESRFLVVRQHKVIIGADLAQLYGVDTKRLNEQVKRNAERFPHDFMLLRTRLRQGHRESTLVNNLMLGANTQRFEPGRSQPRPSRHIKPHPSCPLAPTRRGR